MPMAMLLPRLEGSPSIISSCVTLVTIEDVICEKLHYWIGGKFYANSHVTNSKIEAKEVSWHNQVSCLLSGWTITQTQVRVTSKVLL